MKDHNARQRMYWLMAAFGPPGSQTTTREELDALMVIARRIVGSIPIEDELSEAERVSLPIYGALLGDYTFRITPVVAKESTPPSIAPSNQEAGSDAR